GEKMKKYILGVISDSDLQDRLAGILKENGWYVPRHTDTELVFLTKGGEKIIFSKINKLNGYISKNGKACYNRYNDKGEFLGFINAFWVFERVNIQGISLFNDYREWRYYPAYLNATFKETSIHAVAKDKAYRYDLDFYDNVHLLKNNIALSELIMASNKGCQPSLEALHQGLSPEVVAAFISSPLIIEIRYPMGYVLEFWAQGKPKFEKNGKMSVNRYGYRGGFERGGGDGLIYAGLIYDGFADAFESMLSHSVLEPYTRISISLNPNTKALKNRATSPYRDSLDLEFITGTSFSDDELSDKMGNDLLYAPRDNYVKGNTFIYIDEQMLVIQFGENIVIIGSGDLVTGDDNFAFLGIRHSDDEVSFTGKYFDVNGVFYDLGRYCGELRYNNSFDDVFSEASQNPLSGAPLKGLAWGDFISNYQTSRFYPTKWVYDKILKTKKHYHANTTIKAGKKTYDFLHSSLSDGYGLLIQVDKVKNV
ncbi:MAG: hypothetical protein MR469_00525, partial [Campylobacter sp.]|uniref:hypothetical protein n=2 Tax=Campylobacter sp. TaxID=205 RepID=UPI002AA894F0